MDSHIQPQDAYALRFVVRASASFELGDTFGALLLGTFFSLMLYGFLAHQTFRYFRANEGDGSILKTLVCSIFAVETFQCAALMHMCFHYFVINYSNPPALVAGTWSVQILPLATATIIILSQSFYVRRIYLVDRSYLPIVLFILILMFIESGFVLAMTIATFQNNTFQGLSGHVWIMATIFAVATGVDLMLTGTLVFILRSSYTYFNKTNTVLDKLSLYAVIATGLNTALTIPAFAFAVAQPGTFIYWAIALPVNKLYSNSVLVMLNCRQGLKGRLAGGSNDTPPMAVFFPPAEHSGLAKGNGESRFPGGNESVPPPESYTMVRVRVPDAVGQEDVMAGETSPRVDDAKTGNAARRLGGGWA